MIVAMETEVKLLRHFVVFCFDIIISLILTVFLFEVNCTFSKSFLIGTHICPF